MAYEKKAPDWDAPGVEPPESKRQEGWQPNDRPPAAWWNWFMHLTAESLKELQEKAAEKAWVQDQLDNIETDIPDASLTQKGIVQLNSATNSTSETQAATPKAVKAAYDLANSGQIVRGDAPSNWNNATQNGLYRVATENLNATYTNAPAGAYGYGVLEVIYGVTAGAATAQRYQTHDGHLYYRTAFAGGNWSAWKDILTASGGTINGAVSIVGNGNSNLHLIGNDHVYMEFYPQGTTAGRKSYVGYSNPGSKNLELVVTNADGQLSFYDPIAGTMLLNDIKQGINDAKQSGVDAKQRIVDAINSKGGSASTAMTWAQLAAAIIALVPRRVDLNHSLTDWSGASWPNGGNIIKDVVTFPTGMGKRIAFLATASARVQGNGANTSTAIHGIVELVDQAGVTVPIVDKTGANGDASVQKFMLDGMARTIWKDASSETAIPSNFNVDGAITLRLRLYAPAGSGGGYGISIYGAATYL